MNDWGNFLKWLAPESDRSASEYKTLRTKLITYFIKRNCPDAEVCADQTVERVVGLLPQFGAELPDPPLRFCYGVARYILKEYFRERARAEGGTVSEDHPDPYEPSLTEEKELTDRCLDRCLQRIDAKRRDTFQLYYLVEPDSKVDFRRSLAERLGITINALRLQMLRLKEEVRGCILSCRQKEARL